MNEPGTVALYPGVLGEDEAVKLFTEVLDHVVSLRFTVHQQVEADLLLEADNSLDLLLDEFIVLILGDLSLAELSTGLTDFLGLLFDDQ